MAKYLDPKADLTFKKIFGEHPDLVMSLLNALLPLEKGKGICDIHYLSPERVPRTEEGKAIRLVEESAFTCEQLLGYDMFWDRVRRDKDMADELRETKEKLEETTEQLKKEKIDTARRMKAKDYAIEDIAEITGLTAVEIEGL